MDLQGTERIMGPTRMASAKSKANAKGTCRFLRSFWNVEPGFCMALDLGGDRSAIGLASVSEPFFFFF